MAEIPIQRKNKSGIGPLLLGLLALVLILAVIYGRKRSVSGAITRATSTGSIVTAHADSSIRADVPSSAPATAAVPNVPLSDSSSPVGRYTQFINATTANETETKQHAYTAGGLQRLRDALASMHAPGTALQSMQSEADALTASSPSSSRHADMAHTAFLAAASAFDSLKNPDAAKVRVAAQAVKQNQPLLAQKDQIQTFFLVSADALQHAAPSNSSGNH